MSALNLGAWDSLVRDIAGHDYERAQRIAAWPVVEVLHAYMAALREHAAASYRHRVQIWATLAARSKDRNPPPVPSVLEE